MKKTIIIAILSSTLLAAGCQGFLEEAPKLTQSSELTLSSYKGLDKAVAGAYSPLTSANWYGAYFVLEAEMRSGNAKKSPAPFDSGRMTVPSDMTYNENSTSGLWGTAYYVISAANNVIDNLEDKVTTGVTQDMLDNLHAEALFLRALAHFDLVRLFARSYAFDSNGPGVPIILHTDLTGTEMPARSSVKQVYEQVIVDLLEAETLIDPAYERAGVADPRSVVTLPAIQALLSRAYLYSQQWQKAADYATKVINNPKFTMWTADELYDVWGVEAHTDGEVIFDVYGKPSNSYHAQWESPAQMTSPKGYADCGAAMDIVGLYEDGDVRGELFQTDSKAPGHHWTTKYIGKGTSPHNTSNVVVLRLSEMYLNRAEAILNGATISGVTALSDINTITSKRGATAYTSVGADNVFIERRKELAFEGHYWFDASRTRRGIVRNDYDGIATKKDIPADSYMFALPISKRELDVNENLVQNEGYQ